MFPFLESHLPNMVVVAPGRKPYLANRGPWIAAPERPLRAAGLVGAFMNRQFHLGVFAALFAAWAFSFNFVVPFVIGEFSTFDFAFVRHAVSGMIGLCILVMESE